MCSIVNACRSTRKTGKAEANGSASTVSMPTLTVLWEGIGQSLVAEVLVLPCLALDVVWNQALLGTGAMPTGAHLCTTA